MNSKEIDGGLLGNSGGRDLIEKLYRDNPEELEGFIHEGKPIYILGRAYYLRRS